MTITITPAGIRYSDGAGTGELPSVPWLALSAYTGTTPSTVTLTFSDTNVGSPVRDNGIYQAMILVWQTDLPDDRFRYTDVTLIVGVDRLYLPLILSD